RASFTEIPAKIFPPGVSRRSRLWTIVTRWPWSSAASCSQWEHFPQRRHPGAPARRRLPPPGTVSSVESTPMPDPASSAVAAAANRGAAAASHEVDATLYLHPQTLARLGSFELRAKMIVEGVMSGMHRSPYRGFSVEFAQHRPYVAGDDIRHLDWKVFGR